MEKLSQTNKKIKVLHILEAVAGGTRKVVLLQMRHIDHNLFDVSICIPTKSAISNSRNGELNDPNFGETLKNEGFIVHEIAMLSEHLFSLTNIIAFIKLFMLCYKNSYDVVHCSSSIAGFIGRISAKLAGTTVVIYSPHGFSFFQNLSSAKLKLYLIFETIAGLFTDAFILSSNLEKEETVKLKLSKNTKVFVLENPIEIEKYLETSRVVVPENTIKFVVGLVARLVPQKEPCDFIRMAHCLNKIRTDVEFVIVGDGRLNLQVKDLAGELGVKNLKMLGNRSDYVEIMTTFNVLVMTSLWEGLPYAPIEALLLGIPTVLTDVAGVRDLLGEFAPDWIVPLNSPEKMATIVNNILMNITGENDKALRIRQKITERFDSKKIGNKLGNYYEKILTIKTRYPENLRL